MTRGEVISPMNSISIVTRASTPHELNLD
jgi:hypothetical protein